MRSISKVFVAAAVATACSYAAAGTVGIATAPSFSLESAKARASTATISRLGVVASVTPGVAIDPAGAGAGSLTFATNALAASTSRLILTSNRSFGSVDVHASSFTCSAGAAEAASIVWQLSSTSSASQLVYDAASRGTGNLTNASCAIPSIGFLASSFAATGNVTLAGTVVNINTGFTLDTFASATIASVGAVLSFTAPSLLDAVIDVQSNRLTFASGVDTGVLDRFTLTNTLGAARNTVGNSYDSSLAVTLTAGTSFAFLQDPDGTTGAGSCTTGTGSGVASGAAPAGATVGTIVMSPTSGACSVLTLPFTIAASQLPAGDYSIRLGRAAADVNAASASQFAPQSYTYSYELTSGANAITSGTAAAAGSWTLNGTTVTIQYLPVATDTNLQLFVSNSSASAGNMTFTAYNDRGTTCTGDLGAVAATNISSFGGQLRSALLGTPATGTTTSCTTSFISAGTAARASVVLTSTTPSSGTRIHSGFSKSDGLSRQVIVNSGN